MRIKIVLIEGYYHHEVIQQFITLADPQQITIHLLTVPSVFRLLDHSVLLRQEIQWNLKPGKTSWKQFLQTHSTVLANADLRILLTAADDFKRWSGLAARYPLTLIIHNINAFSGRWDAIDRPGSPTAFVRLLYRLVAKRERYYRKQLLQRADQISFVDPILERSKDRIEVLAGKGCLPALPLLFSETDPRPLQDDAILQVVVPGTISSKGKDYRMLEAVFKELGHLVWSTPVLVYLLGRPATSFDRAMVDRLQNSQGPQFTLKTYRETVAPSDYEAILAKSRLAILPLQERAYFSIYKEQLGQTKASGTIRDVVRLGIPCLLPDFYPVPEDLQALFIPYKDQKELKDQLFYLLNHPKQLQSKSGRPHPLYSKAERRTQLLNWIKNNLANEHR